MTEYTVKVEGELVEWFLGNVRHREDGPAIEFPNGSRHWYQHGVLHRDDGPAIEWGDGSKFWYRDGVFDREDAPAVEYADGTKQWFLKGEEMTEEEHAERMQKPEPDPIVEAVREKFLSRSEAGQRKYNASLNRDDLSREQWLAHLQEELMDAVNYIEVLLQRKENDTQP